MKYKCLFLLPLLVLSSCGFGDVKITLNSITGAIHTEEQSEFINASSKDRELLIYRYGNKSLSAPKPISFTWNETNNQNLKADSYNVYISEFEDLSNSIKYVTSETNVDVFNLKINNKYYYQVESLHGGSSYKSDVSSFAINSKAPRNIFVDGVENVRDIGGWNIGEGKVFKQGMIYRTAQFNYGGDKNNYVSAPTDKGLDELNNVLKIKSDIDLRRTIDSFNYDEVNGITSSPLGENVKYISTPMVFGGTNIFANNQNKESIKAFFNALADESNYPIAFHCMRGTDRTGALSYVIGAMCGMSEDDLALDYLFSVFANLGSSKPNESDLVKYKNAIDQCEGDSFKEQTMNYLISKCDIEKNTLLKIVDILTDESN